MLPRMNAPLRQLPIPLRPDYAALSRASLSSLVRAAIVTVCMANS
jgi:hypothetical protein